MREFAFKRTRTLLAIVMATAGLAVGGSAAVAANVTVDLCASNGQVTMPDAVTVNVWGFVQTGSCGPNLVNDTNFMGATITVNQGDVVTLNVTNALPAGHALEIEIPGITLNPGPVDGSAPITFTASAPGTYLYQTAGDAGRQEAMGLSGALIVQPTSALDTPIPNQAYGAATTAYDGQAVLILSEVDPNFNASPDTFDMNGYLATYWLINGKAYPNTAAIPAPGGARRLLLRYLNAGYDNTSMVLLGMHERVLARDATPLNNPFDADAENLPAGATEDTIATVPTGGAPSANGFPLYNRQLHVTNGSGASVAYPGGMLTFIQP